MKALSPSLERTRRATRLSLTVGALILTGASVGLLVAIGSAGPLPYALLLAVIMVLWVMFAQTWPSLAVAFLILAALNALPILDTATLSIPGQFQPQDGLLIALVLAAAVKMRHRASGHNIPVWLGATTLALVAWWSVVLARTAAGGYEPLSAAVLAGRDLLYLPIAACCCAVLLVESREVVRLFRYLIVYAAFFSLAYLVQTYLGIGAGLVVHASLTLVTLGVARLYTPANILPTAMLPVLLWLLVTSPPRHRLAYAGALVLCLGQVLIQLGRANYLGVAFGLAVSFAVFVLARPGARDKRRLLILLSSVVFALLLAVSLSSLLPAAHDRPSQPSMVDSLQSRFESIGQVANGQDRTANYRVQLSRVILGHLGRRWPVGLGFLHPLYAPLSGLPGGTLRNPDVGALGVLAVMGAVGLVLLLAPVVAGALLLMTFMRRREAIWPNSAMALGLLAFLCGTLASSVTLVTLFSPQMAMLTGALVGCIPTLLKENRNTSPALPESHEARLWT